LARKNWRHKSRKVLAAKPAGADRPKLGEFRLSAAGGAVAIRAEAGADGTPKLATFTGNAYTGQPMRPEGWYRPVVVDLAGVRVPSQHRPVLRQHDHNRIVGHTEGVTVTDEGIEIAGVLSGTGPHVDEVRHLAGNGFRVAALDRGRPGPDRGAGRGQDDHGQRPGGHRPADDQPRDRARGDQLRSAGGRRGHLGNRSGFQGETHDVREGRSQAGEVAGRQGRDEVQRRADRGDGREGGQGGPQEVHGGRR
jgi:hypothetical protein